MREINSCAPAISAMELYKILNETKFKISIEAGSTDCWKKFVGEKGLSFGINNFGKSAPYKDVFKYYGLTSENIIKKVKEMLNN